MLRSNISLTKARTVKRGITVLCAFTLFGAFLIFNIFNLGYFKYQYYLDRAYDQITTTSAMKAERGSIYDSNMNLLATAKTNWRVFISTKEIKSEMKKSGIKYDEIIAHGLSDILAMDYNTLLSKIKNSSVLDVTIKKSASESEYRAILSFIEKEKLEHLVFTEAQTSRYYPNGTLAAHVLGFTGSDNQGLYGLEYSYNSTLSGKDGYYLYAKDAGGNAMPGGYSTYVEPENGYNLITTIDSYIQSELESQLETIRVNHSVQNRVTGIVMDTNTGAILAMATSSPFDPNSPYELDSVSMAKLAEYGYSEGSDEYREKKTALMEIMWSNKAVSEIYEPGSTFKIVTVCAALDSGSATMSDRFSCNGYHSVGGYRIKCHKVTGHGQGFPLSYGLQMSCNPTMMVLADRIGAETFYSYVERFGYFEKTGIDLPSEARTIFHKPENIGSTELATASFGQRFKVSIIAQLTAVAAVANGGSLVEPYLVDKIIDSDGNIISEHKTVVKRQVISNDVANTVSDVLEAGVSGEGGAKNAFVDGYYIAAKTGTSQKFDILDANGNSYLRIGSTVAFAKSGDRSIAAIIVVDEPESQVKYGSVVAAPYVSGLFSKVLPYLEYESSKESGTLTVENYVGMNTASVKKLLDNEKISYKIIGDGDVVLSQMPSAGIDVTTNLSCVYIYTKERDEEYITVPSLCGLSAAEANIIATNCGLNIRISGVCDEEKYEVLTVSSQSLPYGATVKVGSVIVLTVLKLDFED